MIPLSRFSFFFARPVPLNMASASFKAVSAFAVSEPVLCLLSITAALPGLGLPYMQCRIIYVMLSLLFAGGEGAHRLRCL